MEKIKEQLEYYVEHTSVPVFAGMHILDDLFDHDGIARYVNENGDAEIIVFPNQKWVKSKFDDKKIKTLIPTENPDKFSFRN